MTVQNPLALKEKIVSFMRIHGPSLPVHIAKETGLSILFASAFLSELYSDKRVNISHMKVGGSPLYLLPGQDSSLENFWQHLKSKEKDAFLLLKEQRILKDSEQHPAIRVALRGIKDFAIPFQKGEEIFWKYLTASDDEIKEKIPEVKIEKIEEIKQLEIVKEIPEEKTKEIIIIQDDKKEVIADEVPPGGVGEQLHEIIHKRVGLGVGEEIIEKETSEQHQKEVISKSEKPKKKEKKKQIKKDNDRFFEKVKEFLSKKSLEILNVEDAGRNELVLRVKEGENEWMLVAINKRRITENDVINAHKKISGMGLKYRILSLGESTKRIENLINASKELERMEKIG